MEKIKLEQEREGPLKFILEKAQELGPEIIKNYEDIHEHPELGGEEERTAKKVREYLKELGIEILGTKIGNNEKVGRRGEGLVARIAGKENGPTIALRADMDALPMEESEENSPHSKVKGAMHGCGHDAHTAGLMGSAKILKDLANKGELNGNVLLLFQSSEEKAHQKESGAIQIVKFLEEKDLRKDINAFLGLHVFNQMERGKVQLKEGVQLASSGEIDISIKAPGGHVLNIYEAPSLQRIFSKITLKLEEKFEPLFKNNEALVGSTRTIYDKGKVGYNILPSEGESTWVVRITSSEYKKIAKEITAQIKNVVDEVVTEEMGGDEVDIQVKGRPGYRPVVHRNADLVKIAAESSEQVINSFQQVEKLLMGGEDFSYYLEEYKGREIPGIFIMTGSANPEKGYPISGHHSPKFQIDPEITQDLAALYSNFTINAIKYFEDKK